ncbi:MAG: hypothetical protein Q4A66_02815 [Eubacteriales bacterium]|nr:hypothetical protein [Eubacteriales bacterium]
MPCNCHTDPLDRFCQRAGQCCRRCESPCAPPRPPVRPRPERFCPEACRAVSFWPCWNSDELFEQSRPRPRCMRCGCCDRLERQGRFVRCCACGWIGIYEECCAVCCRLRSCCDHLLWPCRPGEPR